MAIQSQAAATRAGLDARALEEKRSEKEVCLLQREGGRLSISRSHLGLNRAVPVRVPALEHDARLVHELWVLSWHG